MGFKEVKTGYRGSKPQSTVDLSPVCTTAWFDWKDGNEEAEDRSGLFVSIEEGMLVIGKILRAFRHSYTSSMKGL